MREFKHTVSERRFSMVNMSDDTKVSDVGEVHTGEIICKTTGREKNFGVYIAVNVDLQNIAENLKKANILVLNVYKKRAVPFFKETAR